MNKPVLVFILSERCGACLNFKRKMLPELQDELAKNNMINFVILDFPDMSIPASNPSVGNYHPELKNGFVRFFPTIALFPGNIWNDHKSRLKGVVKHGDEEVPRVDYSKASVFNWIEDTIKNNSLFVNGNNFSKKMIIPTYGQFKSSKIDETEL